MSLALGFDPGFKFVTQQVLADWRAHALSAYPNEACAFVTDAGLMPVDNIHADPAKFFRVDEQDYLRAVGEGLRAFLHTHIPLPKQGPFYVPEEPSELDMASQIAMAVPWGISACDGENVSNVVWWGDQVPMAPLVGRVFIHGVWDCYSLIRDYYRTRGIVLKNQPRQPDWWDDGERDLYADNFEVAGFYRVTDGTLKPGDVFLCKVRSAVLNHGGVYTGDGLILHHLAGTLSGHSPAVRWQSKLDFIIRHRDFEEKTDAS